MMVALVTEGELGDEATERERKDGGAQCVSVFHLFLVFLCLICFVVFFCCSCCVSQSHKLHWLGQISNRPHKKVVHLKLNCLMFVLIFKIFL